MILDLNLPLLDLDDKPIVENGIALFLHKIIASNLSGNTPGIDPLKAWNWAHELNKTGKTELDTSDLDKLKEWLKHKAELPNTIKAQALKVILPLIK